MTSKDITLRLQLALVAAREAGALTLRYFQQDNFEITLKHDDTPVTVADRQAELLLRESIGIEFPHDAILGEEFPEKAGTSGFRWILDPIDGTKSFIHGVPLYGTLIGVEHEGQSVIGVIHIPALGECIYAAKGQGAWYEKGVAAPVEAKVSQRDKLKTGLFLTSEVISFSQVGRGAAFEQMQSAARLTRTWGDCYGYMLVATGRADLMVDPIMSVWDAAALKPIMEEAGGVFVDWQGKPTIHSGEGIGCNKLMLDEVLAISRQWPKKTNPA